MKTKTTILSAILAIQVAYSQPSIRFWKVRATYTAHSSDGKLKEQGYFYNIGKSNRHIYTKYHRNGNKKEEGKRVNTVLRGRVKRYDEDGKKIKE